MLYNLLAFCFVSHLNNTPKPDSSQEPGFVFRGCLFMRQPLFVFRKPLARLVVPKSLSEEADKKTPFAIIRLRSANCNRKQKEDIQDGTE